MPRPDPVKAEKQMLLCLGDMELASSRPFAKGLDDFLTGGAMDIFLKNQPKWTPAAEARVRRAAAFAGKIAGLCAEFDGHGAPNAEVTPSHAALAIGLVKGLCTAKILPTSAAGVLTSCPPDETLHNAGVPSPIVDPPQP